jgi:hypothetical protein
MNCSVLMVKQKMSMEGLFYKTIINVRGQMVICYLKSHLERCDVLRFLAGMKSVSDIYSIDEKAVMFEV